MLCRWAAFFTYFIYVVLPHRLVVVFEFVRATGVWLWLFIGVCISLCIGFNRIIFLLFSCDLLPFRFFHIRVLASACNVTGDLLRAAGEIVACFVRSIECNSWRKWGIVAVLRASYWPLHQNWIVFDVFHRFFLFYVHSVYFNDLFGIDFCVFFCFLMALIIFNCIRICIKLIAFVRRKSIF